MTKKSWRDVLRVHPAADLFPSMSKDELRELADDIKANGLRHPIVVMTRPTGSHSFDYWLLDGRNRLDAIELAGFSTVAPDRFQGRAHNEQRGSFCGLDWDLGLPGSRFQPPDDTAPGAPDSGGIEYISVANVADPFTYVISANIRRRHLTADQKRELIAKLLKADPKRSNRQVAKVVGASHPHIARVRSELEASGDVETVTTSRDTKGREQPARKQSAKRDNPKTHYVTVVRTPATATIVNPCYAKAERPKNDEPEPNEPKPADNVDDWEDMSDDEARYKSFRIEADLALKAASYDGPVEGVIVKTANKVVSAWTELANRLECEYAKRAVLVDHEAPEEDVPARPALTVVAGS